jgi:hypothetical protein
VTERTQPECSPADFRRDLELFGGMIELMGASARERAGAA